MYTEANARPAAEKFAAIMIFPRGCRRFQRIERLLRRFNSDQIVVGSGIAFAQCVTEPGGTTMRRPERLALVPAAFAAFALSACATLNVSSHIDRGVDFAQFRTWNFGPADALPTGDPRLDNNPFFKDYLEGAVGKALEARRYTRTFSGTPDLLVHYHANISTRLDVNGVESRYGYCYDNCEPVVIEYEQGTIVIDVVDTRTNRVVWRGWAQDSIDGVIDNEDRLRDRVYTSVSRMMARFPAMQ